MAKAKPAREVPARPPMDPEALNEFRRHLEGRLGGLSIDRYSWWTHWREIADYLIPRRYKWLITPNQASRGSPINQRIIDNTGTIALRVLSSGMMSGMTNPSTIWFRLTLDDTDLAEHYSVKWWLEEVGNAIRAVLAESNFYTSLGTLYEDLGAFGTGVMIIYEDFEDMIRCYNSCAGEYYLANSDRIQVDTFYRMFVQTAPQVAKRYGLENCSPTIQQAMKTKGAGMAREVIVAHAIEPNDEMTERVPGMAGKAFREAYWEWGQNRNTILRIRGYHENPVIAPRWSTFGNDAYGRGPGMDALGDIKQLQVQQKRKAQGIDKMVNPPMMADVQLQNQPASLLPGGVTYMNMQAGSVGFKPVYEVKPDISHLVEDMKEVQGRVKTTFFEDLFMMWAQMEGVQPRNELEVMERRGEKLIQLGPVLERFENECLDPALTRVYGIMSRIPGALPPIPPELRGKQIKIEYVSMLAQAQKAAMTTGLEQLASFVGRLVSLNPELADNVDFDEMIQEYADHTGVSVKVVRPFADVLKLRTQRAQQQAQANAMQQSMAAVEGAKTLSETNVGGGRNALQAMAGVQ